MIGDKPGPAFGMVCDISFSPDGSRVAYTAWKGEIATTVVDGVPGVEFLWVDPPAFSADGKRVAYFAGPSVGKSVLVVDGKSREVPHPLTAPFFSPDGKKVAFGARIGRELWWKVMDVE